MNTSKLKLKLLRIRFFFIPKNVLNFRIICFLDYPFTCNTLKIEREGIALLQFRIYDEGFLIAFRQFEMVVFHHGFSLCNCVLFLLTESSPKQKTDENTKGRINQPL